MNPHVQKLFELNALPIYKKYIDQPNARDLLTLLSALVGLKELQYRAFAKNLFEEFFSSHRKSFDRADRETKEGLFRTAIVDIFSAIGPMNTAWLLLDLAKSQIDPTNYQNWKKILEHRDLTATIEVESSKKFPDSLIVPNARKKVIKNLIDSSLNEARFEFPIFTLGSCFAQNLARELRSRNFEVYSSFVAEDVNSPLLNLVFLSELFGKTNISADLTILKEQLIKSKTIVFTLGVCAHFWDNDANKFVRHDQSNIRTLLRSKSTRYRHLKVDEVVEVLKESFLLLKSNTQMKHMVMTVSPVPAAAWFGHGPIFSADTLSKSTLRVAASVMAEEHEEIIYLPTFEVFRTLPAFSEESAYFGADDGSSRHPSSQIVSDVVDVFSEKLV